MSLHIAERNLLMGVDVGGTKVAAMLVDRDGSVRGKVHVPTLLKSPEDTLSGIVEAVRECVLQARAQMSHLQGVGIGIPGRVDPETGVVRSAVNLGWREIAAGEILSARLQVPCLVENDVLLAALGAQRYLDETAPSNMLYIGVGTGIRAGVIINGQLYRGSHGLAGEIGHMVVDPAGISCPCGGRGCLETVASGPAIARLGREAAERDAHSVLRVYSLINPGSVYQAASLGDEAAQCVVRKVADALALALQQLIVAYDIDCIMLGGGVSHIGEAFLQTIQAGLERVWDGSVLAAEMMQPDMIRLLPADYDAGTWGAVSLASKAQG